MKNPRFVLLFVVCFSGLGCGKGTRTPPSQVEEKVAEQVTKAKKTSEGEKSKAKVKEEVRDLAEKMIVHEIQGFSVNLQVPESWERKDIGPKAVSFRGQRQRLPSGTLFLPRADVYEFPGAPKTLEEAAAPCTKDKNARNIVTEQLASGAYFYSCEKQMAGHVMVQFKNILPVEGGLTIQCGGSAPLEATPAVDICRSLSPVGKPEVE